MPRNITSQMTMTNPLNGGIHNVLLKPKSLDDASGSDLTMSTEDLIKTLDEISSGAEITEDHLQTIQKAQKYFGDFAEDLNALYGALQNNTDSPPTRDPFTNKKYKTGPELAEELKSRIVKMDENKKVNSSKVFNMQRFAAEKAKKSREERDKKKTRGNPFRVLMGQVGKMLDHGISKKDIIRYIAKKNMWNEETISKAVDVVSDYSKKKRSKEKKFQEKKSNSSFNITRTSAIDAKTSIYEVAPDFLKRSTAELMARASWLNDLLNYNEKTPQGDVRKAANKDGVNAELKKIREALKARGFEENELP